MLCNKKIYKLFFLSIFFFCQNSFATINEIQSLKDPRVQAIFLESSAKHLYLFDVDFTLITPSNPLLDLSAMKRHETYFSSLRQKMSDFESEIFNHLWIMESSSLLTEPQWPSLITQAQNKGATTLGFTAAKTGPVGPNVPDFKVVRYNSLKQHGIDFDKGLVESYVFENLDDYGPDKPAISQGIVYAGRKCKKDKEVIDSLLKVLFANDKTRFTKIIVFEDRLDILENLQKFMQVNYPHIHFVGMHYSLCENIIDSDSTLEDYRAVIDPIYLRAVQIANN